MSGEYFQHKTFVGKRNGLFSELVGRVDSLLYARIRGKGGFNVHVVTCHKII